MERTAPAPARAPVEPPDSETELLARARAIAGHTLGELGRAQGVTVPADARHAKGLAGRLVERALGADAGTAAAPDFRALSVELKTIPLDAAGLPQQSTYVCRVELARAGEEDWERSRVRRKLARVLWVPIEHDRALPLPRRRVGLALLWSPSAEQEAALRTDWEELTGIIGRGDLEQLDARVGRHLQVRPKAASGRVRARAFGEGDAPLRAPPRGFYLRASFTAGIFGS